MVDKWKREGEAEGGKRGKGKGKGKGGGREGEGWVVFGGRKVFGCFGCLSFGFGCF